MNLLGSYNMKKLKFNTFVLALFLTVIFIQIPSGPFLAYGVVLWYSNPELFKHPRG